MPGVGLLGLGEGGAGRAGGAEGRAGAGLRSPDVTPMSLTPNNEASSLITLSLSAEPGGLTVKFAPLTQRLVTVRSLRRSICTISPPVPGDISSTSPNSAIAFLTSLTSWV